MASRIRQPKPGPSGTTARHHPTATDLRSIQASLHALHAPALTIEELGRLSDGPFGDALVFICEHVRGRQGVADARATIHTANQRQNRAGIPGVAYGRGESGVARSSIDKACSRLAAAKTTVKVYEEQLSERQASISSSHDEVEKLQRTLDEKLRIGILLDVLREREEVRIRRFTEITRLVREMRNALSERGSPATASLLPTEESVPSNPPDSPLRKNNTTDTLANLHAHHVRLSSLASRSCKNPSAHEVRLLKAIALGMGYSETDKRVVSAWNKFLSEARLRAAQKVQYHQPLSTSPSNAELGNLMRANKVKQQELQTASDMSAALQFLCDHFIQSISVFLQSTSTLRPYLDEETQQAKGYIDVLRESIVSSSTGGTDKAFAQSVREACGIAGNVPLQQVLQHVEDALRRVHRQEDFLASSQIYAPPLPSVDEIAEYRAKQKALDAQLATILEKKLIQAQAGDKFVDDISMLVKETNALVGVATT